MSIWKACMWIAEWRIKWRTGWSSQLYTQLLQLRKESLRKERHSFRSCKSCVYDCDDHPSFNSSLCSSRIWFSYIHNFIIILSRVYNEPIRRPAPSWLVSLIGSRSAAPYVSQSSRLRIPYKPEFFPGFLFETANVAYITAMIIIHLIIITRSNRSLEECVRYVC